MITSKLFIVIGAGGVGKTTSAAALGVALAKNGFRTCVVTVDPAKRLAQVLGLESLSNKPKLITTHANGGRLSALWLDTQTYFDDFIERHLKNPERAKVILENRLFRIMQMQMGGLEEYLGVEKVISLGKSGDYDICILDTPPARHALDFLESPKHILRFFDESILKMFLREETAAQPSSGFFQKLKNAFVPPKAIDIFRSFLGGNFLGEFAELLQKVRPIYSILKETSSDIEAWIQQDNTRFISVANLEPIPLREFEMLSQELTGRGLRSPDILVLNKALTFVPPPSQETLSTFVGDKIAEQMHAQYQMQEGLRSQLKRQKSLGGLVLCESLRYSSDHLSMLQLEEMGEKIYTKWKSADPSLFSKP